MSKDLLNYLERIGAKATQKDASYLYNMLVHSAFSHSRSSCIGMVRKKVAEKQTLLNSQVNFLSEQIVGPTQFSDAQSRLLESFTKTIEKNQLGESWICNALLAMLHLLSSLNQHDLLRMGSRNKVFWSYYEKDGIEWYEIAIVEIRIRKSASLQTLLQKKLFLVDLSCYYYKGSNEQ